MSRLTDAAILGEALADDALAHQLQVQSVERLRLLIAQSVKLALSQTSLDEKSLDSELEALRHGRPLEHAQSLRAQANELDEQVDSYADSFPKGWPQTEESRLYERLFQRARLLSAICEAADQTRSPLESAAWCLYEMSFAVGQKALRSHLRTSLESS